MDFSKIKKIYMIGIKGVGMTMLAEFLAHEGYILEGSDVAETFMSDAVLEKAGIKVHQGFSAEQLDREADLVVYSSAYNEHNNEELKAALDHKMRVASYAQTLSAVFNLRFGIAVCGSHGKTTTSAWLGFVLHECGLEPTVMAAASVPQFEGSGVVGKSNYMIIEADEYQNKLQYLNPKMIVLNNIDYDHPDFFENEAAYIKVFEDFISKVPKSGALIANFDDTNVRKLALGSAGRVVSYGTGDDCDYKIVDPRWDGQRQYFKLELKEEEGISDLGEFGIQLNGMHNVYNAAAVIVASIELNAELHLIRRAVGDFTGTARRMQRLGDYNGALVYDDYAHHPTEIKATLGAIRQKWPERKLRVVFHPHTFSRTEALLDAFAKSFKDADEVIVLDIYSSARENHGSISGEDVAQEIHKKSKREAIFLPTLEDAEEYIKKTASYNDFILLMGAGDVFRIGEKLFEQHD